MPVDSARPEGGTPAPRLGGSTAGRVVVVVLAAWVVIALVRPPGDAQDAVPLVVAGELVRSDPEAVYVDEDGSLFDLRPAFAARSCEVLDEALDCDDYAVAFVSTPGALPLVVALSWAGPELAIRLLRLLGAACLVVGVLALWRRLAGAGPRAPALLAGTAVAMTPLALIPIGHGQTTPLLFLSVVLGTSTATAGRPMLVRAATWALAVAMKLSPVLLAPVLVVQRRWRLLAVGLGAVAVLHVVGVAIGGTGVLGGFVTGSRAVADQAAGNPYNGALEAALVHAPGGGLSVDAASAVGMALRLGLGALAVVGFFRLGGRDVQWAFAWAVLVALSPMSWWHYSLVSLGAVGVAVAESDDPDRWLPALPLAALVGLPLSIANSRGWSVPSAQLAFAVACAVGVYALGRRAVVGDRRPVPVVEPR